MFEMFDQVSYIPVAEMGMVLMEISMGKVRVPLSDTRHN